MYSAICLLVTLRSLCVIVCRIFIHCTSKNLINLTKARFMTTKKISH